MILKTVHNKLTQAIFVLMWNCITFPFSQHYTSYYVRNGTSFLGTSAATKDNRSIQ